MTDPGEVPATEASAGADTIATRLAGLTAGAAGAGVALGFGELIEGTSESIPSLVIAVGEVVTDYTPGDIVAFTIDNLGNYQKSALTAGIVVLSLIICGLLGRAAARGRPGVAVGGFALFGLVGGWAAARNPLSPAVASWIVALVAAALGAATTLLLVNRATAGRHAVAAVSAAEGTGGDEGGSRERVGTRRSFFGYAGGAAVTAVGLVGIGRSLRGESAAEKARETYALPSRTPSASAEESGPADVSADSQTTVESAAPSPDPSTPTPQTAEVGQAAPSTTEPASQGDLVVGDVDPTVGDGNGVDPDTTQSAEQPAETVTDQAPTTTQSAEQIEQPAPTTTQQADEPEPAPTTTQQAKQPEPTTTEPAEELEPAPTTTQPPEEPEPAPTTTEPPRNLSVSDQVARLDTLDEVAGISSYITPITPRNEFYRIDTALTVPQVDPADWRLRITGMVDQPYELTFDDILGMELSDHVITLACVSNPVGGNLVGNAIWTGVPLAVLLERAGAQRAANQVVGRSVDDFTAGFPTGVVHDGRNAILAIGMNDELLPTRHGFPARLVVAGLYGYVSAVKWLEEIHLTTWDGFDGYWVPRGWSKRGPMKTQSRIDVPKRNARLKVGEATAVAGIAWAPTRGISRVETKIGNGDWTTCRLGQVLGDESWVQWHREWTPPTSGSYEIKVRATDGTGTTQGSLNIPSNPNGAEGHHTITVSARR